MSEQQNFFERKEQGNSALALIFGFSLLSLMAVALSNSFSALRSETTLSTIQMRDDLAGRMERIAGSQVALLRSAQGSRELKNCLEDASGIADCTVPAPGNFHPLSLTNFSSVVIAGPDKLQAVFYNLDGQQCRPGEQRCLFSVVTKFIPVCPGGNAVTACPKADAVHVFYWITPLNSATTAAVNQIPEKSNVTTGGQRVPLTAVSVRGSLQCPAGSTSAGIDQYGNLLCDTSQTKISASCRMSEALTTTLPGQALAMCGTGERLLSGGGRCEGFKRYWQSRDVNAQHMGYIVKSEPQGNGWYVECQRHSGDAQVEAHSYAVCCPLL